MRKDKGRQASPSRTPPSALRLGGGGKTDSPGPAKPGLRATRVFFIHLDGGGYAAMYV